MRVAYPGLFLTWLVGQLMQFPQNFGVQLDLPVFTGGSTGLERSVAEDLYYLKQAWFGTAGFFGFFS